MNLARSDRPSRRDQNSIEVGEGIWRLGTDYINWYLLGDRGSFTLVDTGLPGYWPQLASLLANLGARLSDIEAVVITHHHPDHRGNVASAATETGARVRAHPADWRYLRGDKALRTRGLYRFLWRPWYLGYVVHLIKNGLRGAQFLSDLVTLNDGERLPIPGEPTVIHAPGHTLGSCALLLEERGVLLSGDALVTLDTSTGRRGPAIIKGPVTHDAAMALSSLKQFEHLHCDTVLPGHGEPWTGGIGEAVARARAQAHL
jgi:glyoxylase-like metal-dependent hydrolase (beta-lactamase superfamily II)